MRMSQWSSLAACTLLTMLSGFNPASADDTEVFFSDASGSSSTKANILLILDTSGSMNRTADSTSSVAPFDSSRRYNSNAGAANCPDSSTESQYYYWPIANGTKPTSCNASGLKSFDMAYLKCDAAVSGLTGAAGYYGGTDKFIRIKKNGSNYAWNGSLDLGNNGYEVECAADNGIHGESGATNPYPKSTNASSRSGTWTATLLNQWWGGSNTGTAYYIFTTKYIRYNANPPTTTTRYSRLDVVKTAVAQLMGAISDVNVGVMRYDVDANGGMVVEPVTELTLAKKTSVIATVDNFQPNGSTPLSETLYEAYLYLAGKAVDYGNGSRVCNSISNASDDDDGTCAFSGFSLDKSDFPSVAASRTDGTITGTTYKSPLATATCKANNHIIYLTDGLPTSDTGANSKIETLTGKTCAGGSGTCLSTLSEYLFKTDLAGAHTTVKTHYIGFGADVVSGSAVTYLTNAATAGGGQFYTAGNITSLTDAFQAIFNSAAADTSATFTSPSVAVNSFNKTQILEDLYVGMFKPGVTTHWPGNLKKFKLRPITITNPSPPPATTTQMAIVGESSLAGTAADTVSAVDSTSGFFKDTARDFWQNSDADTDATTKGGAAHHIPFATTGSGGRNLYTYVGVNQPASPVSLSNSSVTTANTTDITDARLGTNAVGCGAATDPCRDTIINWARGDDDGDLTDTSDIRHEMGDPIHSQPAIVIYANTTAATATGATIQDKVNDAYVYVATNDGYLHAIDVVTGEEKWAWIPKEFLSGLKNLYFNDEVTAKHYALDGDIRILRFDQNNDGKIDTATDRVILFVSQGRGGDRYYALDITQKDNPKFMWSLGSSDLDPTNTLKVQQSWSTPTLGRVQIGTGSTQNSQRLVLIFGAGYDAAEDAQGYQSGGDTYGNGLYIVDAVKGTVLWKQTKAASGAFAKMTHAIPSNVTAFDSNNDGYTDRMYVGDMAGQLWRFDIVNCLSSTATCASSTTLDVRGGVFATLGATQSGADALVDNRTFYSAPDPALIVVSGSNNYWNISLGSGDRSFPKSNVSTSDRFYSLRDYTLAAMTQTTYDSLVPIKESDLQTVNGTTAATFASDSKGWKLQLSTKEKSLAPSITVDGVTLFTTFIPGTTTNSCVPTTGSARSYAIGAKTAIKKFSTLYEDFATTGLPPSIGIFNTGNIVQTGAIGSTSSGGGGGGGGGGGSACMSGVVIQNRCVAFGNRIKTIWSEAGAN